MNSIKCDDCIYLGARHESGTIPIQSGATTIDEPYLTCTKLQYFVLERMADMCKEFKPINAESSAKPYTPNPDAFSNSHIEDIMKPGEWYIIDTFADSLDIQGNKKKMSYLQLRLKSMVKNGLLSLKIEKNLQYWQLKEE